MRYAEYTRKTKETEITVRVNLDGEGKVNVNTGITFLDHMMRTLGVHGSMDLKVEAKGDLKHHVMEDVAICLGEALRRALGDAVGIARFGYAVVPMDDALALAAVDLVTRPYCRIDLATESSSLEDTKGEDLIHFFETLATSMKATIHVNVQYGINDHHKVEAATKALALSLRQAVTIPPGQRIIPSAKGSI
ncbi:imidazoleglycerol-phosphate dehydratase HisB [Candidatus Bathyarchaeota archaeon]|jgi:imidazoleglycerol-phosphate dehydratase|nr:imidazoleglycerol-phosphate dehydratase HisB [Candidatus Bathyarchaeota archaeon]